MLRLTGVIEHAHKDLCFVEILFIMDPAVIRGESTFSQIYHHGVESVQANALVAIGTEDERLTLFQEQRLGRLGRLFGEDLESPVIKDVTVLIDLKE